MSDLTPDDLIKAWLFQDQVQGMARSLLAAGVELGIKATTLTLAEMRLKGQVNVDDPHFYDKLSEMAKNKAIDKLDEKLDTRAKGQE